MNMDYRMGPRCWELLVLGMAGGRDLRGFANKQFEVSVALGYDIDY